MSTCPICYSDDAVAMIALSCGHACCIDCLKRWFETEETTGQAAPTCPMETCRRAAVEDATAVLGRPFVPAGNNPKKRPRDAAIDAATQKWLDQNAYECGGCQTPLIKASGCDKLQCLCGFRVCWKCRAVNADCQCNPGHGFVDNITGMPSWGPSEQVATAEEMQNFKGFLQARKSRDPFLALRQGLLGSYSSGSDVWLRRQQLRDERREQLRDERKRRRQQRGKPDNTRMNPGSWSPVHVGLGMPQPMEDPFFFNSSPTVWGSHDWNVASHLHQRQPLYGNPILQPVNVSAVEPPLEPADALFHTPTTSTTTTTTPMESPLYSLLGAVRNASNREQRIDLDQAIRLSVAAMSEFDREMEQALRLSLLETSSSSASSMEQAAKVSWLVDDDDEDGSDKSSAGGGTTASNPVLIIDDDDEVDRKPSALKAGVVTPIPPSARVLFGGKTDV